MRLGATYPKRVLTGKLLMVSGLMLFGATVGYSQTRPATTNDNATTNNGEGRPEHNWSWVGLIGLLGLGGLKPHKSEDVRRLESHGVKVTTV